jgi:hypothetical protein
MNKKNNYTNKLDMPIMESEEKNIKIEKGFLVGSPVFTLLFLAIFIYIGYCNVKIGLIILFLVMTLMFALLENQPNL